MFNGRKDVYEFYGTLNELYLLLDIKPEYDKAGNRKRTINELLNVRPLFTVDGYEVPRVLSVKNKMKKGRAIHSKRLHYAKFKYKRNRAERIDEEYDENFLIYLDKLKKEFPGKLHMAKKLVKSKPKAYPMKFAKGSKVKLKKVNHISKKYIAMKVARGASVSLRPKMVLKNRPPMPTKFVKSKTLKQIKYVSPKTGKQVALSDDKLKKKEKSKVISAKKKATPTKGKASASAKKPSATKKAGGAKKKKAGGAKRVVYNSKERISQVKIKAGKVKAQNQSRVVAQTMVSTTLHQRLNNSKAINGRYNEQNNMDNQNNTGSDILYERGS